MTTRKAFPIARRLRAILTLSVVAQAPAFAVSAPRWTIDPTHTHISFAVDAGGYPRTRGEFRRFEGRISIDFEHPERTSVAFHLQSRSVDVRSPWFSDYVRSAEFLDVVHHPSIDFISSSVDKIDDHTVRVSGDLTLLGVTKPLSVDVSVRREDGGAHPRFVFTAETQIDRLDFGMGADVPLVSRYVGLVISSEAAER